MPRDSRNNFQPSLMERLIDEDPESPFSEAVQYRHSLSELKQSVAQDVEALLNSRHGMPRDLATRYPQAARSFLAFGLEDFAGRSLLNPDDRVRICRAIEDAIAFNEPRLKNVQVSLDGSQDTVRALKFRVTAILHVEPAREPVDFDAMLQPNTQQYQVRA